MTEFPETQSSLLAQIKSLDDHEAWEQFVLLYRPVIYRIARRRGFQEADAQDLAQRVLTSVAKSIHRWKKIHIEVRFRNWLRRVVKNAIINASTRRPPEIAASVLCGDNSLLEYSDEMETEREIELEYRREIFKQAAAAVSKDVTPQTWRAFELTVIENQTVEEAAAVLETTIGSVYAARSRIMRRLQVAVEYLMSQED